GAGAGQGRRPGMAAVPGADQPAELHQRRIARCSDLVQPHVAVGRLSGADRVQRAVPPGGDTELHASGDQLTSLLARGYVSSSRVGAGARGVALRIMVAATLISQATRARMGTNATDA